MVTIRRTDHALREQFIGVQFASTRVLCDLFVHQRLGQRWSVLLVVTELTEAHNIDHHVFVELHPEIQRNLRRKDYRFGVIAVHVQHRRFNHLDHIRAVQGRT